MMSRNATRAAIVPPIVVALLRRFVLVVLVMSLASGGVLPVWAQLAGIEGPHVCHCSTDHHDCVCAHCGTDHDAKAFRSVAHVKGRCGDDEVAFGGRGFVAIVPQAGVLVVTPTAAHVIDAAAPSLRTRLRRRPPTPPPRLA